MKGNIAVVFLVVFLAAWSASAEDTIEIMIMGSGPTAPISVEENIIPDPLPMGAVMLPNVPTSSWTYGCSATSAGMIFGYYDRIGYSNMYAGSANGGVAPLTDLGNQCTIIATAEHINDYWISNGSSGPDPWESSGTEHTWADCTADYMGTNQWKWDTDNNGSIDSNSDGSTTLYYYSSATKLYDYIPSSSYGLPRTALCHGMRLFAESRGYTVLENYTQSIDTLYAGGFSFDDYMDEIDAGWCRVFHH